MELEPENQPEFRAMTFEIDGKDIEVKCRFVDLHSPEYDKRFEGAPLYRKKSDVVVSARQARAGEVVETKKDATTNTAKEGEWVVTGPKGESWIVAGETFEESYRPKEDEEGKFIALGVPARVIKTKEDIVFRAPWGEFQGVRAGGYVLDKEDGERYGVEKEAFEATYESIEEEE